jgi:hypothetical protein
MFYYCKKCKAGFDELGTKRVVEHEEFWGTKVPHEQHYDCCPECGNENYIEVEELYTKKLGLRYLEKHKDFYLNYFGVEKVDKDLKADLIGILEKEYQQTLDMDTDWNKQLQHLKNYIFEYMEEWIVFLEAEGKI